MSTLSRIRICTSNRYFLMIALCLILLFSKQFSCHSGKALVFCGLWFLGGVRFRTGVRFRIGCSFLLSSQLGVFISFVLTKETNQRKGAADVAEAKNRAFCLSPPKLAALKQRMTFNDKRLDFLYASSTKAGPSG